MAVLGKILVKNEDEYDLLEMIINPKFYSSKMCFNDKNYKVYRNSFTAYRNADTKEIVNINDYYGDSFVNTRLMCSKEFLNSDFFKNNEIEIIFNLCSIIKETKKYNDKYKTLDLDDKSCYKLLNSNEFLTSDFIKNNYDKLFKTLDNIAVEKEKVKVKKKIR